MRFKNIFSIVAVSMVFSSLMLIGCSSGAPVVETNLTIEEDFRSSYTKDYFANYKNEILESNEDYILYGFYDSDEKELSSLYIEPSNAENIDADFYCKVEPATYSNPKENIVDNYYFGSSKDSNTAASFNFLKCFSEEGKLKLIVNIKNNTNGVEYEPVNLEIECQKTDPIILNVPEMIYEDDIK